MANLLQQTKDEINSKQKRAEALKKDCKRLVVQLNTLSQQLQYPTKGDVLTSNERKLILFLTAQAIQQKRLTPYVVKISDLPKIMGIKLSGGTYRKRLIKTLENLAYKKFNIVHQPHTTMLWIQFPIFHPKEHTVGKRRRYKALHRPGFPKQHHFDADGTAYHEQPPEAAEVREK